MWSHLCDDNNIAIFFSNILPSLQNFNFFSYDLATHLLRIVGDFRHFRKTCCCRSLQVK